LRTTAWKLWKLRARYFHGLPYAEAARFSGEAVPILLAMLSDEQEKEFWANIILVLGIIGDERAFEPLIGFLEQPRSGEISSHVFGALRSVSSALGHMAAKGHTQSLAYLMANTRPEVWQNRKLRWRHERIEGALLNRLMAASFIASLGRAATPAARAELERLAHDETLDEALRGIAQGSIKTIDEINTKGRQAVFDKYQHFRRSRSDFVPH
jgi:HEAT repeat protein